MKRLKYLFDKYSSMGNDSINPKSYPVIDIMMDAIVATAIVGSVYLAVEHQDEFRNWISEQFTSEQVLKTPSP